jgi:hypothetical protein
MSRVPRLVVVACLALAAACSQDDPTDPVPGLGRSVDESLGGSLPSVDSATGTMDLDLAAAATVIPAEQLRDWLRTHGFQGGYSRVWARGTEQVTALAYRFFADRDAEAFVSYSADLAATSSYYTKADDPAVPGARAFAMVTRGRNGTQFCGQEYFTVYRDAFVVTRCAGFPVPSTSVAQLAQRQLIHAVTTTGATPTSGTRSP